MLRLRHEPTAGRPRVHRQPRLHGTHLEHDLGPIIEYLAGIPNRRRLTRDRMYQSVRADIIGLLAGFEWSLAPSAPPPPADGRVVAVAWNIERGKRFTGLVHTLTTHPRSRYADLLLLTEVDVGMARSGNRNVARELAAMLGCGYVYCNNEILLSSGDAFEPGHVRDNRLGLHGCALLTRWPVARFCGVPLPEYRDKFYCDEKRLGGKRSLVAEVLLPDGPVTVAVVHLDPFAPPRHRARQIRHVLRTIDGFGNHRALIGGDLNTNTYDLGSRLGLAINTAHKLLRFGFLDTVRQYMTPEHCFERATFAALARAGFEIDPYNDRSKGSTYYDLRDPELADWTGRYLPRPVQAWLHRRLAPWDGCVPLRVDWFAGRGLQPRNPSVLERPRYAGRLVSDHDPLFVDLELS